MTTIAPRRRLLAERFIVSSVLPFLFSAIPYCPVISSKMLDTSDGSIFKADVCQIVTVCVKGQDVLVESWRNLAYGTVTYPAIILKVS